MTDHDRCAAMLDELERLHEAATPDDAISREAYAIAQRLRDIGGSGGTMVEFPFESVHAELALLLRAGRRAHELTAMLCTEPGQDVLERAKALVKHQPKCVQPGCRSKLSWPRAGGEWPSEKRDNAVAIRCLECGSVLCPHHAQEHFDESVAAGRKREQLEAASLRAALAEKDAAYKELVADAKRSGYVAVIGALHNAMPPGFVETDTDKVIGRVAALVAEKDAELGSWKTDRRVTHEEVAMLRAENAALRDGEPEAVRWMRAQRDVFCDKLNEYIDKTKEAEGESASLGAELAKLRAEVAELQEQASMACIEPRDDCDCHGCSYAAEVHAKGEKS